MAGGFVEAVADMARTLAMGEVRASDEEVCIAVPHDGAEPVHVFVRACGEMHGKEVLEFSSEGLRLPDEDAHKMPLLILALQRNADVIFGHWGLDESPEGTSALRVFHSQITETMDPPELQFAVQAVANEYATFASAFDELVQR